MISVTILVKNAERTLKEVLLSLKNFDEIVLLDTGSTDKTLEIAKAFTNVTIYQKEFLGFGHMHNMASELAKSDWILSIDADEVVSKDLATEILSLKLDANFVYALPRHNFFNNKEIKFSGWQREKVVRLYNKKKTSFSEHLVHEGVITKSMKVKTLNHPLLHTPYSDLSDFLRKMELYSSLFAREKKGKKKSSPLKALTHGFWAFFRSFVLKKGFLGGYEGFLISIYNGHTCFYKYLKLYHANIEESN